jgi:hypothetical protein
VGLGFPFDGVDFLTADVAQKKRRVVGGETGPGAEVCPEAGHAVKVDHAFKFAVGDANAEEARVFRQRRIEVDVLAVARPAGVADGEAHEFLPLLGGAVEQHEILGIVGDGRDVAAVG